MDQPRWPRKKIKIPDVSDIHIAEDAISHYLTMILLQNDSYYVFDASDDATTNTRSHIYDVIRELVSANDLR